MTEKILKQSEPIAKKTHTCTFCNRPILKGDKYFRLEWITGDNELLTDKRCKECCDIIDKHSEEFVGDDDLIYPDMWDEWCRDNNYPPANKGKDNV